MISEKLSDYSSLIQFIAGINLVVGAYAPYRRNVEDSIEDKLDIARSQIDEILDKYNPPTEILSRNLEKKEIKNLSDREIARYLGDVSIRFYDRCYKFGKYDPFFEFGLPLIGIIFVMILIYSAIFPEALINEFCISFFVIVGLIPALFSFLKTIFEIKLHEKFYRRKANDSYKRLAQNRHNKRKRTDPIVGEIFRVTNQVRVRNKNIIGK